MRPEHAAGTKWLEPVKAFLNKIFQNTDTEVNFAMVLCPFPLEFDVKFRNQDLDATGLSRMNHRRKALVRHYRKTLGVELTVAEDAKRWWMGRML